MLCIGEIKQYLETEHTANNLAKKAFIVISTAFAARTHEMVSLQFCNLELMSIGDNGGRGYRIGYKRGKRQVSFVPEEEYCCITGPLEVQVLDDYIDCFPAEAQHGRLLRVLKLKRNRIVGTFGLIGVHTMGAFGQAVAQFLGKEDWKKYTGHCWRRTAITWAASSGLSLAQLKVLSDHRSDSVVQGYIDRSDDMREAVSGVVSVETPNIGLRRRRDDNCDTDLELYSPPCSRQRTKQVSDVAQPPAGLTFIVNGSMSYSANSMP